MKKGLWILAVGLAFLLWWSQGTKPSETTNEEPNVERPAETPRPPATKATAADATPIAPHFQSAPPASPTPGPTINPYHVDRFSLRNLTLPEPKSVPELLASMTGYKPPMLPKAVPGQGDDGDGDVLTGFRGYSQSADGTLRKAQLDRYIGEGERFDLALEDERGGEMRTWSASLPDDDAPSTMQVMNCSDDPYGLVLILPDQRFLYLKFHGQMPVAGLERPTRTLIGWIISTDRTRATKVALVDAPVGNEEDSETGRWPQPESIRSILPRDLPVKK